MRSHPGSAPALIFPEVKSLVSPDLDYGVAPPNPQECTVYVEAEIGPKNGEGAEIFSFTCVTPAALAALSGRRWGRGYLILDFFSWRSVEEALANLLCHCSADSWNEVATKLNKELHWEFENYRATDP
jgi:Immunity protein 8